MQWSINAESAGITKDFVIRLIRNCTRVVQIDATQVRKELAKIVLRVKNGVQVVISQDERVKRGEHGAKLAHLAPVLQIVVCNVQQPQWRARSGRHHHSAVLIKAQEQLFQSRGYTWRRVTPLMKNIVIIRGWRTLSCLPLKSHDF